MRAEISLIVLQVAAGRVRRCSPLGLHDASPLSISADHAAPPRVEAVDQERVGARIDHERHSGSSPLPYVRHGCRVLVGRAQRAVVRAIPRGSAYGAVLDRPREGRMNVRS